MNIILTGADGFIGTALQTALTAKPSLQLTSVTRTNKARTQGLTHIIGDIHSETDWTGLLRGQDVVIHCAARAHVMKDGAVDPLAEYRRVNVDGTANLARQAARAGVHRFIYLSSIKVNGEQTASGAAFRHSDTPAPEDDYGLSKLEAETALRDVANAAGMEWVIIRPPLVYGPGVKGNFATLITLAHKNLPLPLGAVRNQRSFVALDNLVDLIQTCIDHPAAANETFLVSDDQDLSTTELVRELTLAAGKSPRLLPMPTALLRGAANLLGRKTIADRLLGSLQVDIAHTRQTLNWTPPVSVQAGLKKCFT